MLILQEFKAGVTKTVLQTLTRSGRLPCMFFALGEQATGESYVYQKAMATEYFIREDDEKISKGSVECLETMRENPQFKLSCLAMPQYLVRYSRAGKLYQQYLPYLYNNEGELLAGIVTMQETADEGVVQITPVLTLCYEYPVGEQTVTVPPARLFAPASVYQEKIFGATHQVICCKPHPILGLCYDFSYEHGTEHRDKLPFPLAGRGLQAGKPIELTQYAGMNPWTFTIEDALAVLSGSKTRVQ